MCIRDRAYCVTLMFYQIVGLCIGEVAFNFWTVVAVVLLAGVLYLLLSLIHIYMCIRDR